VPCLVERHLNDLSRKAKALHGTRRVRIDELFPRAFMRKYTRYGSFDEMVKGSGFKVENEEDFTAIPDADWDRLVKSVTRFESWHAMREQATADWSAKKLGLR